MESEIMQKLCSKAKLDRDRGYSELEEFISRCDQDEIVNAQQDFIRLLSEPDQGWESRHGGLSGARCLFEQGKIAIEDDGVLLDGGSSFAYIMIERSMLMLDHEEFRVRIAAGKTLQF